ncbi:hypothetical protein BKA93DRAFT_830880 [Sparassis latifolia]
MSHQPPPGISDFSQTTDFSLSSGPVSVSQSLTSCNHNIADLDLSELLKNHHVLDMYNELRQMSTQVVKLSDSQAQLMQVMQENKQLTQELQALKAEKSRSSSFASSSTILPSDSASRRGGMISRDGSDVSASRPHFNALPIAPARRYPPAVLWYKEDIKGDEDITISVTNPVRIPMDKAVRHADGELISLAE